MSDDPITKKSFGKARIVTTPEYKPSAKVKPHINTLLESAYHTLMDQIRKMQQKSEMGIEFDDKDTRKLGTLIDSMTKLAREEREQAKAFDPGALDDEDLLFAAKKAAKLLGVEKDEE